MQFTITSQRCVRSNILLFALSLYFIECKDCFTLNADANGLFGSSCGIKKLMCIVKNVQSADDVIRSNNICFRTQRNSQNGRITHENATMSVPKSFRALENLTAIKR